MTMSLQYCDDTMLQLRGNVNFCVFEMKTMDIMLHRYHINTGGTNYNEIFGVFE